MLNFPPQYAVSVDPIFDGSQVNQVSHSEIIFRILPLVDFTFRIAGKIFRKVFWQKLVMVNNRSNRKGREERKDFS